MEYVHINVRNEPKQSIFLETVLSPIGECWEVFLGADRCQDIQLTPTWKRNPGRKKKEHFFFFKHANIFHILAGVVKAGPWWKFGEA